jgi:hypothetical protein
LGWVNKSGQFEGYGMMFEQNIQEKGGENHQISDSENDFFENGIVYSGEFKNNQKNGLGFIAYDDNTKYSGNFMKDAKHGHGIFRSPDKRIYYGQYEQN